MLPNTACGVDNGTVKSRSARVDSTRNRTTSRHKLARSRSAKKHFVKTVAPGTSKLVLTCKHLEKTVGLKAERLIDKVNSEMDDIMNAVEDVRLKLIIEVQQWASAAITSTVKKHASIEELDKQIKSVGQFARRERQLSNESEDDNKRTDRKKSVFSGSRKKGDKSLGTLTSVALNERPRPAGKREIMYSRYMEKLQRFILRQMNKLIDNTIVTTSVQCDLKKSIEACESLNISLLAVYNDVNESVQQQEQPLIGHVDLFEDLQDKVIDSYDNIFSPSDLLICIGGNEPENNTQVLAYNPDNEKWHKMKSCECSRQQAAAAVWNGKVVVTGGKLSGETAEQYDDEFGEWSRLPDLRISRHRHGLVTFQNNLFAIGGDIGELNPTNNVEKLGLQDNEWRSVHSLTVARLDHAAVATSDGKHILVIGGSKNPYAGFQRPLKTCELFDGSKAWKATGKLRERRMAPAAAAYAGHCYVFGGGEVNVSRGDVEQYNEASGNWTLLERPSVQERHQFSAVCIKRRIYLTGGFGGKAECFHTRSRRVSAFKLPPSKLYGHCAVACRASRPLRRMLSQPIESTEGNKSAKTAQKQLSPFESN